MDTYTQDFYNLCVVKLAFIRKLPNGKYRVVSRKGKNLGTYDSKSSAEQRLKEVEFFKHKNATKEEKPELTYSSIMRFLNKNCDPETINDFQKTFKENFDRLYLAGEEEPENKALEIALTTLDKIKKKASAIDLGDPEQAGGHLAQIVRFLLTRINPEKRAKAIQTMRKKIYYLNEYNIAGKKTPPSSSMGQSLTLLKTILLEHNPQYIRAVLNAIVRSL